MLGQQFLSVRLATGLQFGEVSVEDVRQSRGLIVRRHRPRGIGINVVVCGFIRQFGGGRVHDRLRRGRGDPRIVLTRQRSKQLETVPTHGDVGTPRGTIPVQAACLRGPVSAELSRAFPNFFQKNGGRPMEPLVGCNSHTRLQAADHRSPFPDSRWRLPSRLMNNAKRSIMLYDLRAKRSGSRMSLVEASTRSLMQTSL